MIENIKKFLIENIVYVIILFFAGIYFVIDKGIIDTLNYASILLALFIPFFLVIKLYRLTESILLKERIEYEMIIACAILITLALVVYIFALNDKQRLFLYVYDGILSVLIVIVMLFKTLKNRL
jgi:hypothetical protein